MFSIFFYALAAVATIVTVVGIILMKKKANAFLLIIFGLVFCVMFSFIGYVLTPLNPQNKTTSHSETSSKKIKHKSADMPDNYVGRAASVPVNENDNSESSLSSSSSVSSSSAELSSVDYTAELKAAITSTMTKESYQNIEDGVLEAAKVDDVNNYDDGTPYALKRFESRTKNLQRLQKQNNRTLKEEKANLDSEHYSQLSSYTDSANNYLEALYDYAVEYQTDVPSLNNPNTTSDTAETLRASLQEKKDAFDQAKQAWIQNYDNIVNQ
ncbi:hypothetical protein [Ligilactobacillus agilis]|uniref:hypothetical protein n=1 Tax=Ligilactobacillus agilis TaxID=1601 RepID=UPI003F8A6408